MKILLAVDGSDNSRKAVEHVAQLASECDQLAVTLYYVLPTPESLRIYGESVDAEEEQRLNELMKSNTQKSIEEGRRRAQAEILELAEQTIRRKAPRAAIDRKFGPALHRSIPEAIVREAHDGGYDAVVLGRRGRSALVEATFGSVTSWVLHHASGCAVWIVG